MLYSWLQCCVLEMEIGFTIHFSLSYDATVFTFSCTITETTFLQFNHVAQPAGTVLLSCSIAMAADVRLVCQGLLPQSYYVTVN